MIEFIFHKTSRLLTECAHLLRGKREKCLLGKVQSALINYKHINVYAINAEEQINDKLTLIREYIDEIGQLLNRLQQNAPAGVEANNFINELSSVLASLKNKKDKLIRLKTQIPEGMLDIKRALIAVEHDALSHSPDEDSTLKHFLMTLKDMMQSANREYNLIIKQGGSIHFILFETTKLYWMKLDELQKKLYPVIDYIDQCAQLTPTGMLVQRCLYTAHINIPSTERARRLLNKNTQNPVRMYQMMGQIGFSSHNGRTTCAFLQASGKPFFHMPHNETMYHIDYDPECDLAETAGNCFGESMMFIHALSMGRFQRLCPEAGIINFQLEQTRRLAFKKTLLGEGETPVSADSIHQSLQWEDAKKVLIDNPHFNPGDICGMSLSMNEYTQSQTPFTTGHIAVLARLDESKNIYKYIVFEKELGVFGVVDDESLEYIVMQQIMTIYEGMNYSKIKLNKYGEATPATYQFISKIKPITEAPAQMITSPAQVKPNAYAFFEAVPLLSFEASEKPSIGQGSAVR